MFLKSILIILVIIVFPYLLSQTVIPYLLSQTVIIWHAKITVSVITNFSNNAIIVAKFAEFSTWD